MVLFSRISRVKPSQTFPLQFMSIYSNDNISKITKLTPRELPHLAKTTKITVRKNNGVYSTLFLLKLQEIYLRVCIHVISADDAFVPIWDNSPRVMGVWDISPHWTKGKLSKGDVSRRWVVWCPHLIEVRPTHVTGYFSWRLDRASTIMPCRQSVRRDTE